MYSKILVPVDGSETANLALAEAVKLASQTHATIVLLHVVEDVKHCTGFETAETYFHEIRPRYLSECQALLEDAKARASNSGYPAETVLIETGDHTVAQVIVTQAQLLHADLIVLGTHGRKGFDRLMLGSDAEQVARTAPVPVMLVRAQPKFSSIHTSSHTGADKTDLRLT